MRTAQDCHNLEPRLIGEARAISPEYFNGVERERRMKDRAWLYQVVYLIPTPGKKYIGREVVAQAEFLDIDREDVIYSKWTEALESVPDKLKRVELEEFAPSQSR